MNDRAKAIEKALRRFYNPDVAYTELENASVEHAAAATEAYEVLALPPDSQQTPFLWVATYRGEWCNTLNSEKAAQEYLARMNKNFPDDVHLREVFPLYTAPAAAQGEVTDEQVERALTAWHADHSKQWSAFKGFDKRSWVKHMRAALTAALASKQEGKG